MNDLQDLQSRYLDHMRIRNFSIHTVQSHDKVLGRFRAFCSERGVRSVEEVTREAVVTNLLLIVLSTVCGS
jgi:site-specific recombinase XerD